LALAGPTPTGEGAADSEFTGEAVATGQTERDGAGVMTGEDQSQSGSIWRGCVYIKSKFMPQFAMGKWGQEIELLLQLNGRVLSNGTRLTSRCRRTGIEVGRQSIARRRCLCGGGGICRLRRKPEIGNWLGHGGGVEGAN